MYLRELFIKNNGPLDELRIDFAFTADNLPIPYVIVGKNGTGKTNLLSIIADALMEGAADVYRDILTSAGIGRNWFRIVGGKTMAYKASGGFSILRFEHNGESLFYREITGEITAAEAQSIVSPTLSPGANWGENDKNTKTFQIKEEIVRSIYEPGAHIFFPSSRSEVPFWLNQDSLIEDKYDSAERYSTNLGKPMFVEHGIDLFAQWLLGVLNESKADIGPVPVPGEEGKYQLGVTNINMNSWTNALNTLGVANQLLQFVTDDPQARFYWAGRRQPRKVGVASGNTVIARGLDSLSGGQSSLLAVFGTILRYGDMTGVMPKDLQGIVVIDELDAHMHIDLQMKAIPKLIAVFPRVQFIISSHSPIFALGMEKQFPENGVAIINMPRGLPLAAEAYEEFENALRVFRETRAFQDAIGAELLASETPTVWVSGPTDERYFKTAAQLLGYEDLVDKFQWVGAQGPSGSTVNSGDNALNAALNLLKANPKFSRRKVILVYDCDAKKPNETTESVDVIGLEAIPDRRVKRGVENLLRPSAIPDELYKPRTVVSEYGETTQSEKLDKTALCDLLCGEDADVENFRDFEPVLEAIRSALSDATGETEPTDQSQAASPTDDEAVQQNKPD
jgi:hypothetical protein